MDKRLSPLDAVAAYRHGDARAHDVVGHHGVGDGNVAKGRRSGSLALEGVLAEALGHIAVPLESLREQANELGYGGADK